LWYRTRLLYLPPIADSALAQCFVSYGSSKLARCSVQRRFISYLLLMREGDVRREHRTDGGSIALNCTHSSRFMCLEKINTNDPIW